MKTLILYYSQYSTCKQYAIWVSEQLNTTLIDIKHLDMDILCDYDLIIFGAPVYFKVHKGEHFINKHKKYFKDKTILLFDCGLSPYHSNNFPTYHLPGTLSKNLSLPHSLFVYIHRKMYINDNVFNSNTSVDKQNIQPLVKAIKAIQAKKKA